MRLVSIAVRCCACAVGSWLPEELGVVIAGGDRKGTSAALPMAVHTVLSRTAGTARRESDVARWQSSFPAPHRPEMMD